jgi:hypothetical protein
MKKFEIAQNLAFFLLEKTGSVCGKFKGTMKAADQRKLFGMFLGKGMIVIDGANETIQHIVKVCFGQDYDVTFDRKWNNINLTSKENNQWLESIQ